eukprot:57587_1
MSRTCISKTTLEIEECPFIEYIVSSLSLFADLQYGMNINNYNKFDLNYLSKCYNHIICIHLFCSNSINRENIQHYVCDRTTKCTMKQNCVVLKHHLLRKREVIKSNKIQQRANIIGNDGAIMMDILQACLNSLHVYLIHTEYGTTDTRSRFISKTVNAPKMHDHAIGIKNDPLQFDDEIDDLIEFTLQNADNFVVYFLYWITNEEYDWDSLLNDMDCNTQPFQSNMYLFFLQHQKQHLFDLICAKYENDIHDMNNDNKDNKESSNNINA